ERTGETRRVEAAHLAAGFEQRPPQASTCTEAAQPVVDQPDPDALACPGRKNVDEASPDFVVGEYVILEEHRAACHADRLQPGRIVLVCVLKNAHVIARHERSAACSRERLLCEQAQHRLGGGVRAAQIQGISLASAGATGSAL